MPIDTPRCCGLGSKTRGAWWASAMCVATTSSSTLAMTGRHITMRCVTATLTTCRLACASWAPAAASPRTLYTSVPLVPTTGKVGSGRRGCDRDDRSVSKPQPVETIQGQGHKRQGRRPTAVLKHSLCADSFTCAIFKSSVYVHMCTYGCRGQRLTSVPQLLPRSLGTPGVHR